MLHELILSTIMVVITVVMHAAGLFMLTRLLRNHTGVEESHAHPESIKHLLIILVLVLALFTLHGIEIWCYGFVYLWLGALPDLRESIYFSTITYAAIGYDDDGFAEQWRLVAAIEGVNGVLLLGWSTAFFVTIIARLRRA